MNLPELNYPVRIYWDIAPLPPVRPFDYLRLCEEILEIRILHLDVRDTGFHLGPPCGDILEKLRNKNIAVSLTLASPAFNPSTISLLSHGNIKAMFLEASSFDELKSSIEKIKQYGGASTPAGLSCPVEHFRYRDIPGIVSLCLNNGITHLVIPMQRVINSGACSYPDKQERDELSESLQTLPFGDLKLIIHDPFLWRVFYPTVPFPANGCQAANTMLYISPAGDVYPCPSMPVKLGSLGKKSLKDIILSSEKKELRKMLITSPRECLDCDELNQCRGGCRGRAYVLTQSMNEADPACD